MKHLVFALAAVVAAPATATAETPMNGAEFDAFMTGKTLTFSANGAPYGVEYYAPNRRVIWSFIDGDCVNGEWYEDGRSICFVYENDPEPKCWEVFENEGRLRAVFMNQPGATTLYEVDEKEPLICNGVGA